MLYSKSVIAKGGRFTQRQEQKKAIIEKRGDEMMKRATIGIVVLFIMAMALSAHAVTTVYTKTALTTGTATSLDGIDGAVLNGGDMAMVTFANVVYFYILDASNSSAESSPDLITPNSNPGTKRWVLQGWAKMGTISGTPTQYQWTVWTSATQVKGVSVTGSKVVCTDANGEPVACTTAVVTGLMDGLTHVESANGKTIDKLSALYIAAGTNPFVVPTPTSAGGNMYCFKQANNATNVITVVPVNNSGVMLENTAGTAYCTADDKLVSGGAKTDKLCIAALDATHYETVSFTGTWTCTAH
jgi:hypothetical protein